MWSLKSEEELYSGLLSPIRRRRFFQLLIFSFLIFLSSFFFSRETNKFVIGEKKKPKVQGEQDTVTEDSDSAGFFLLFGIISYNKPLNYFKMSNVEPKL